MKKGVDGVVEEDQQGQSNWKHKSNEECRQVKEAKELQYNA